MEDYFQKLVNYCRNLIQDSETFTLYYSGEKSDFSRFNQNLVRQAGHVEQHILTLQIASIDHRQSYMELPLVRDWSQDTEQLKNAYQTIRSNLVHTPPDPYLIIKEKIESSRQSHLFALPPSYEISSAIQNLSQDLDLVGILAAGEIYRGFANSIGQVNWYEMSSVNFDWSVYHDGQAIKDSFSGFTWDELEFSRKISSIREKLHLFKNKPKNIQPGSYRVYLAPAAVAEIWELISWAGLGLKSLKTQNSPLRNLYNQNVQLDSRINLFENPEEGLSPRFNESGFLKPESLSLIHSGQLVGSLVSARSEREFQVKENGANENETPHALGMLGGNLSSNDILRTLNDGLYISNLWYLNYSDLDACRITGLTRFASFWVENGELRQPLDVMRFDESLYRMFGENLVDVTTERELIASSNSYQQRSTSSMTMPGAIIEDFRITL